MIRERAAARHTASVRSEELKLFRKHRQELLSGTTAMSYLRENLLIMPSKRELAEYEFGATIPTYGAELLASVWKDLHELVVENKRSNGPEFKHMARVVNKFILPIMGLEQQSSGLINKAVFAKDAEVAACEDAEEIFAATCWQINTGKYAGQDIISVYHDANNVPLALRKRSAASSAVTLEPLSLYDTIVPQGTIIGVDGEHQVTRQYIEDRFELRTYLIGGAFSIHPVRLAPLAYEDPFDKAMFAQKRDRVDEKLFFDKTKAEAIDRYSLGSFRYAAEHVMQICGVTTANSDLAVAA